jgi:hypothetical protein
MLLRALVCPRRHVGMIRYTSRYSSGIMDEVDAPRATLGQRLIRESSMESKDQPWLQRASATEAFKESFGALNGYSDLLLEVRSILLGQRRYLSTKEHARVVEIIRHLALTNAALRTTLTAVRLNNVTDLLEGPLAPMVKELADTLNERDAVVDELTEELQSIRLVQLVLNFDVLEIAHSGQANPAPPTDPQRA